MQLDYTAYLTSDPTQIIVTKSSTVSLTSCVYTLASIDSFALGYASFDHKVYVSSAARSETFTFYSFSEPSVTDTLAQGCID